MIIKASQRGGASALAAHLMNGHDNEHVEVHRIDGFMGESIHEAFEEIDALSKGTRCQQYLFSVSLSPPPEKRATTALFERTAKRIAEQNGLENQPYVMVFHEKQGRRHAHCVWSRIDVDNMRAINLPYFKNKLMEIGKSIYLEQGWRLPEGHMDRSNNNPLNFTLAEWQQAKRQKRDPKQIKQEIKELWLTNRSKKAFESAMNNRGYYLACGNPRRSFVFVDWTGQVRSLSRHTGAKTKELSQRLGDAEKLQSVEETKKHIDSKLAKNIQSNSDQLYKNHQQNIAPLLQQKKAIANAHQKEREALKIKQEKALIAQRKAQQKSLARGIKGLWQRITGERLRITRKNELEALRLHQRSQQTMDDLIFKQLEERQELQQLFDVYKLRYETALKIINFKSLSHMKLEKKQATKKLDTIFEYNFQ
ncbi:relaxase/mobilization nuclease domain-containing protein [Alteromonas sp. a30]|uniref:relaxase/mobilization nuclease domain-containing protein n=1 Tax=Alteromonas sp. a30 TaxID=2730917 RepID=UPI00227EEEF5|nr:relaxase/mobilization nuclease domain-containing protein [Alteromonas sp. a30]MCY7297418.1 relaxase/mobilization nuclease domain-containing protein [Alteromonas sp. a30]